MENRTSYTIVGVFVMFCVASIASFTWWMATKKDPNEMYISYYIQTSELPSGLKEGADVRIRGVSAGIVKNIYFADINRGIIEIEADIKSIFPISKDSIAKVESQGIGGVPFINIQTGSGEIFDENTKKPTIELDKDLLSKMGSKAEIITDGVNETIYKINTILSAENIAKINESLSSFNQIAAKLNDEKKYEKVDEVLENANLLIKNLNKRESEFGELLKNVNDMTLSITKLSNSINTTQSLVAKRLERGEFNVKEILNPTLDEAKTTFGEFNKVLREFQGALFRLENNPYEFFFRDTTKKEKE